MAVALSSASTVQGDSASEASVPADPLALKAVSFDDRLPLGGLFYGNYQTGLHVGNTRIALQSSRRFRAERSGLVHRVRYDNRTLDDETIHVRCDQAAGSAWCNCQRAGLDSYTCGYTLGNSYSVGNGGEQVIELHADDDGLPGEEVLGRTEGVFIPKENEDHQLHTLALERAVAIEAGQIYHLVYRNQAPPRRCPLAGVPADDANRCDRNAGAIGLNGVFLGTRVNQTQEVGVDPFRGQSALNLYRNADSEQWQTDTDNLSWFELGYTDDVWVGDTYNPYGAWHDGQRTVQGLERARQVFTVHDASRTVNGFWVNVGFDGDSAIDGSSLHATLHDATGDIVADGQVASSAGCAAVAKRGKASGSIVDQHCRYWGYADLSKPVELNEGEQYRLELSAGPRSGFVLSTSFPLDYYGAEARSDWTDARAQFSTDGGKSWKPWAEGFHGRDLPVLFTLANRPKLLH